MGDQLGDKPIDNDDQHAMMGSLATALDAAFNGGAESTTGFILMVFPLNTHEGHCNYISNVDREDVIVMLKQQLERFGAQ